MRITVIGLGYVGSVAASGLANAGHQVLGVDIDRERVRSLSSGNVPFYEPGLESRIVSGMSAGDLRFCHPDDVRGSIGDIALIATGTPPRQSGAADLSQVRSALDWIKSKPHDDLLVVMKSTVPPGTGCRLLAEDPEGSRIRYASNPEFLREGRAVQDWDSPDRIVIGVEPGNHETVEAVKKMHAGISAPFVVTDITSAEMTKYASNAFLATRISFINEIAALCDRVGASIDAVSEGLAMDPRTGGRIYAGVGYGGSCFPKDARALDYLALTSGVNFELLRSVINVNNKQRLLPLYALRSRFGNAISGLRVGVLGLAFKPQTDDVRDAPSLDLIRALVDEGVQVQAFDPRASQTAAGELPSSTRIVDDPVEASAEAHALVLLTEWEEIINADWKEIALCMRPPRFVFDGRNCLSPQTMEMIGFEYHSVGRDNQSNPFV